jgi:ubiquinone/menaquinone biosynthesis C-methylase UbiE
MRDFDASARDWDNNPKRVERANAVAAAIREMVPLSPAMTAFEYGCGTGLLSFALQPSLGPITLADSSSGMLAILAEKIALSGVKNMTPLKLDLATDPLPTEKYALIYMLMVLHHIPDTAALLKSFHDMLLVPGYLCIADLDKEDGSFHGPGEDVHSGFARETLQELLMEAGFATVRFSTCFEMTKNERKYPLFLAVAEKKG